MTDGQDQPLNQNWAKSGNKAFDRRRAKHNAAIDSFSLAAKSPQVRSGIVMDRGCTDVVFLFFFFLIVCAMVGEVGYALIKGDPTKLFEPLDGDRIQCGVGDYKDYPALYISNMDQTDINSIWKSGICVKKCPENTSTAPDCKTNTLVTSCSQTSVMSNLYESIKIGYVCFPKDLASQTTAWQDSWKEMVKTLYDGEAGSVIKDVTKSYKALGVCLALSIVFSIIYMYMMSLCAWGIAMVSILIIELTFFGGAGGLIYAATQTNVDENAKNGYFIAAAALVLVGLIWNCCLCCNWKAMKMAIAIIDAAADFFSSTKRLIFVSIFYFFVTCGIFWLWTGAAICLLALGDIKPKENGGPQQKDIQVENYVYYMQGFLFFGALWIILWINDKTKFITMVSAATYYFDHSKTKTDGGASVLTGFKFAYFKHAGSLAVGSFIHTVVTILRMIAEAANDAATKEGDGAAKLIACLITCCMRCLEDLIEYLNATAYCYMAISGESYCTSAWNGFMLNLKHCAKFYYAVTMAKMFVLMGILGITGANCGAFYLLMKYAFKDLERLNSIVGPIALVAFITFIMACIFLGLFDEAVLCTIHCFAVDTDLNGKPEFGPPSYHEKLNKIFDDEPDKGGFSNRDNEGYGGPTGYTQQPGQTGYTGGHQTNQMM